MSVRHRLSRHLHIRARRSVIATVAAAALVALTGGLAYASSVDESIVDATSPTGSVTLTAGGSGSITINLTVTGRQDSTATFKVNRDWALAGGSFTGSNPQTFTVSPRAATDPATTFSTIGMVSVDSGQADGTFTLAVHAFDIVTTAPAALSLGRSSNYSVTVSTPAPSDTTAPSITPHISGTLGDNGWYTSDVTLTWTVNDSESAITSTNGCDQTDITADQPATDYTCSATSAGGTNSSSVSIKRDATAPTITDAGPTAAAADGLNGWYVSAVTETFTASDATGSGLADCAASFTKTSTTEGSAVTIASGTCSDNAGNTASSIDSPAYKIDLSDPTNISFVGGPTSGGSYYYGSVPAAPTCTADDAVSGLASCLVTGYSSAVGGHTLTATATDNAGRTSTATRNYSVLAWTLRGFYQPVDMSGVLNTVKGGSTVPLKFEIFAGSTELTDTADIATFTTTKIACDGTAPQDAVEVTSTGGTSLRYDTTGGQFIQNWKTPTGAGQCYRATMTALDGSAISALFKIK